MCHYIQATTIKILKLCNISLITDHYTIDVQLGEDYYTGEFSL